MHFYQHMYRDRLNIHTDTYIILCRCPASVLIPLQRKQKDERMMFYHDQSVTLDLIAEICTKDANIFSFSILSNSCQEDGNVADYSY